MPEAARVLLVEDDPDIAALLRHHVEKLGHDVHHVTSAEEAMACAAALAPDLALVDIKLPGADGRSLVRWLRDSPATADCRVVVASIVDVADIDVDVDAVLAKPFRRSDVQRALTAAGIRASKGRDAT